MDLSNIKPAKGSVKDNIRLGRGQGSGKGGTSGKGHKGAKSRSGNKKKKGFEGGQMPIQRRLPKFGFKNINRVEYKAINLDDLQELSTKHNVLSVDVETLIQFGLVAKHDLVKILGRGKLASKLEVKAHSFSKKAIELIEAKGGSTVTL